MLSADYPAFESLIRSLEKLYGKSLDDDTMQSYWHALRDVSLETAKRRIEEHVKRAKFFPKPVELRPRDSSPTTEPDERSRREFDASIKRNEAFWDEELRIDAIGTKWKLLQAYEARTEVMEKRGTRTYQDRVNFANDARSRLMAESSKRTAG